MCKLKYPSCTKCYIERTSETEWNTLTAHFILLLTTEVKNDVLCVFYSCLLMFFLSLSVPLSFFLCFVTISFSVRSIICYFFISFPPYHHSHQNIFLSPYTHRDSIVALSAAVVLLCRAPVLFPFQTRQMMQKSYSASNLFNVHVLVSFSLSIHYNGFVSVSLSLFLSPFGALYSPYVYLSRQCKTLLLHCIPTKLPCLCLPVCICLFYKHIHFVCKTVKCYI